MFLNDEDFEKLQKNTRAYLAEILESSCLFQNASWKYLEKGQGDAVLCLHGIGYSKVLWKPFIGLLAEHHRVIAPDIPGLCLRTDFPAKELTIRYLLEWLKDFLKTLDVPQIHIIGHGLGGTLATYFTAEYPEKVLTYTWLNPTDQIKSRTNDLKDWENVKTGFDSVEQATQHRNRLFYSAPNLPDVVQRSYINAINKAITDGRVLRLLANESPRVPLIIAKQMQIQQHSLLVSSSHDVYGDASQTEQLSKKMPNAQWVNIEDCGHFCLIEKTAEVVEVYKRFLGSC